MQQSDHFIHYKLRDHFTTYEGSYRLGIISLHLGYHFIIGKEFFMTDEKLINYRQSFISLQVRDQFIIDEGSLITGKGSFHFRSGITGHRSFHYR